tara:strand:+ start:7345 stop:8007 length:663 start_codon:yes stop_codon:yes gene_type:complete
MVDKRFLLVGHPRCGTGFMSEIFKSFNLDVPHERIGKDGTSCWFYASENQIPDFGKKDLNGKVRSDFRFKTKIQNVRDPFKAIPSIYFTETPNGDNKKHWAYRFMVESLNFRKRILKIEDNNIFNVTVKSYLGWNGLIKTNGVDLFFRVEDADKIEEYLKSLELVKVNHSTYNLNSRKDDKNIKYKSFPWGKVDDMLIEELDVFCEEYGYESLTKRISDL